MILDIKMLELDDNVCAWWGGEDGLGVQHVVAGEGVEGGLE